jgi:hypothetical protein
MKERFEEDAGFLKIGLQGIPSVTGRLFDEVREVDRKAAIMA